MNVMYSMLKGARLPKNLLSEAVIGAGCIKNQFFKFSQVYSTWDVCMCLTEDSKFYRRTLLNVLWRCGSYFWVYLKLILEELVYAVFHETEPTSFEDAVSRPVSKEWIKAIQSEVSSLKENKIWELCCLPRERMVISGFSNRRLSLKREVCRYKVNWSAKNCIQRYGLDFVKTFVPVAKFQSITRLIAISAYYGLKLEPMIVVTALLNPDVQKEIYTQFPQGLDVSDESKKGSSTLRLLTGLFSFNQARRLLNEAVSSTLHRLTFTCCDSDSCLFVRKDKGEFVIIALYVNDLILMSNWSDLLSKVKAALKENYKMTLG